jgi:GLPGLI family protein
MRKMILIAGLAIIGFGVTAFVAPKASTDNNFEGIVTYSMTVDNPQAAAMMQGSSIKVYVKGNKSKAIADMGMYKRITFMDHNSAEDPITLVEAMGNKYQLKNDKTKKDEKTPDIKYTDETKQIAGYTCHKAEITMTDEQGQSITSVVYYTEDIISGPSKSGAFKGLKGFPMEYNIKTQGMTMSFSATKVDKQSVSEDTFKVPAGYKLMTQEEMQQDMMKSQGGN